MKKMLTSLLLAAFLATPIINSPDLGNILNSLDSLITKRIDDNIKQIEGYHQSAHVDDQSQTPTWDHYRTALVSMFLGSAMGSGLVNIDNNNNNTRERNNIIIAFSLAGAIFTPFASWLMTRGNSKYIDLNNQRTVNIDKHIKSIQEDLSSLGNYKASYVANQIYKNGREFCNHPANNFSDYRKNECLKSFAKIFQSVLK